MEFIGKYGGKLVEDTRTGHRATVLKDRGSELQVCVGSKSLPLGQKLWWRKKECTIIGESKSLSEIAEELSAEAVEGLESTYDFLRSNGHKPGCAVHKDMDNHCTCGHRKSMHDVCRGLRAHGVDVEGLVSEQRNPHEITP